MTNKASVPTESASPRWRFGQRIWTYTGLPRLMGILNVTPDSFSDGGKHNSIDAAISQGLHLAQQGADVIDIGGESTRPGAEPVPVDEELRRVIPVIERLANETDVPISIDTMKAHVAREALAAGASIINDVTALTGDPKLIDICAKSDCGIILMHMLGTPQTMQADPRYDNVVTEVKDYLLSRVNALHAAGIDAERIMLDPGIGFGKTAEHNVELLQNIKALRETGHSVLVGHSRKRFLYSLLGRETDERLAGTIGVSIALAMQSTDLLRVHDVGSVRDALRTWQAITAEN